MSLAIELLRLTLRKVFDTVGDLMSPYLDYKGYGYAGLTVGVVLVIGWLLLMAEVQKWTILKLGLLLIGSLIAFWLPSIAAIAFSTLLKTTVKCVSRIYYFAYPERKEKAKRRSSDGDELIEFN